MITDSDIPTEIVPPPESHYRLKQQQALQAIRDADRHLASATPRLAALVANEFRGATPADIHRAAEIQRRVPRGRVTRD